MNNNLLTPAQTQQAQLPFVVPVFDAPTYTNEVTEFGNVLIINCTPHAVNVVDLEGNTFTFLPFSFDNQNPCVIRATQITQNVGTLGIFQATRMQFGDPIIPQPLLELLNQYSNIVVITSMIAVQAIANSDYSNLALFVAPGTAIRNAAGQVTGCTGFSIL